MAKGTTLKTGIVMGQKYRDSITGFEGVATAVIFYLYGCTQVSLKPTTLKDGKSLEGEWYDEQRVVPVEEVKAKSGGPAPGETMPSGGYRG